MGDDTNLRKTFLPDDYFKQTANMIQAGIHVQVPHEMDENFWIKKLAHATENPNYAGMVGWVDLTQKEADLKDSIQRLTSAAGHRKIVSFRHVAEAESNSDWLMQPKIIDSVKIIGSLGFTFDLLIRTKNIKSALKLVESCTDVRFVIDHMAKPEMWASSWSSEVDWDIGMRKFASMPNVYCKISGFYSENSETQFDPDTTRVFHFVRRCFELFGPERIFWGSDWPVSYALNKKTAVENLNIYIEAIRRCTLDSQEIENIFCNNATLFYKL